MKNNFTPGPWLVEQESYSTVVRAKSHSIPVAEVWLHSDTKANAYLIAAAPDLLEALRPFAALMEQAAARDLVDNANVDCQVSMNDMRRAHEAIRKATREAP